LERTGAYRNRFFKINFKLDSKPADLQRLNPVLSLRALAASSRGLKKDYPCSDFLKKHPDPSIK
jgi:hypothetical protein